MEQMLIAIMVCAPYHAVATTISTTITTTIRNSLSPCGSPLVLASVRRDSWLMWISWENFSALGKPFNVESGFWIDIILS